MKEIEVWKDILNYEGIYQVSSLGRIKSLKFEKEKVLKQSMYKDKYYTCALCLKCKSKTYKVHKLVAVAFLNHVPCGMKLVVNHINFIRTDNRVENLEIITTRENANQKHLKTNRSSEYTGVNWHKRDKKWRAKITINGKEKFLGYFINEYDAHLAYENELNKVDLK